MPAPVYVLGTGLSHDGSSCLLKDGRIIVAIEKERLTRKKHDGGNDSLTVQYCLDYAGIPINDLSLVVQAAHFEKETILTHQYSGPRAFPAGYAVPVVTISHHLAHAYSAIGTSPFDACNVMVIDGSGNFYEQCDDLENAIIPADVNKELGVYGETNSFYFYDGQQLHSLYKDFSVLRYDHQQGQVFLPTARHSIGGLYAMASNYCFGSYDDAGKLMGLAPYGKPGVYKASLFTFENNCVRVDEPVMHQHFISPAADMDTFKKNFQYYADIARWVQDEAEKAILYLFKQRLQTNPHPNMAYAGGVALNAVTNAKLLQLPEIQNLYIEPAAGDNGLAIGCAYYGWLNILKQEKVKHSGSTLLGKPYGEDVIENVVTFYSYDEKGYKWPIEKRADYIEAVAQLLSEGKTISVVSTGCRIWAACPRQKKYIG